MNFLVNPKYRFQEALYTNFFYLKHAMTAGILTILCVVYCNCFCTENNFCEKLLLNIL